MFTVSVIHNFETAHRLPFLGGKCTNLHGHSWLAEVELHGVPDPNGIIADFGALKKIVRSWIDENWDHGAILGREDPLWPILKETSSKVYVFEGIRPWPTVESVAWELATVLQGHPDMPDNVSVYQVEITETAVNKATWRRR